MRPDTPTLAQFVDGFLSAHRQYTELLKQTLDSVELTHPQFELLVILAEAGPEAWFRVNDLVDLVDIQQSGISKIIRKFDRSGYVETHSQDHHQRSKRFKITQSGYDTIDEVYSILGTEVNNWFTGWTNGQLEQLNHLLDNLNTRMAAKPDMFIPWPN